MAEIISFVTWKWSQAGFDRAFKSSYVNILRAMVARHCPLPHRFICITDETAGLDRSIETLPMPVTFEAIPQRTGFPECYRRLWNFSQEASEALGPRILALDIDVIITRSLVPLISRPENFVGWTDARFRWKKVAGGLYLLRTGTYTKVWTEFDPHKSPAWAKAAGCSGSDQGWLSFLLYPPPAAFVPGDGVYSIRWLKAGATLPSDVRIVSTPGELKPWSPKLQRQFPWIAEHWKL